MRERLMTMSLTNRQNCYEFLKYMTNYDLEELNPYQMSDNQLFAVAQRIRSDITRYIEDIIKYQETANVSKKYTKEELEELTYNELAEIRRPLKPKKVKVTHRTAAPLSTTEEGKSAIENDQTDYFDNEEITFITPQEGYMMFGSEFSSYSEEELFSMGYKLEFGPNPIIEEESESKIALKKQIIKFILETTDKYTKTELKKKNLEQLIFIYEALADQFTSMPTVNEISHQLRLGTKKN